ncbi:MAG: hypothetical protein K2L23_07980 [Odoribacter sp.]|nr:hypothetical protein [Odoribacter sp.]
MKNVQQHPISGGKDNTIRIKRKKKRKMFIVKLWNIIPGNNVSVGQNDFAPEYPGAASGANR